MRPKSTPPMTPYQFQLSQSSKANQLRSIQNFLAKFTQTTFNDLNSFNDARDYEEIK